MNFDFNVWLYCSMLAAAIPVLIPTLQFGFIFKIWDKYNKPVNRDHCVCTCWDTVFKGEKNILKGDWVIFLKLVSPFSAGYETGPGSYKHVYFNATANTMIIWAMTVTAVVLLYEGVRKVFVHLYNGELLFNYEMWNNRGSKNRVSSLLNYNIISRA